MEVWEMTYRQYCIWWKENSRYGSSYRGELWENRKRELLHKWVDCLSDRALQGTIPAKVIRSYVGVFGKASAVTVFRGVYEKGIADYLESEKRKIYREKI